jgi:hypothetical protein
MLSQRAKYEVSVPLEVFGFAFVILGAVLGCASAPWAIPGILGAVAIWFARYLRDPHYWTVRLPGEYPDKWLPRYHEPESSEFPRMTVDEALAKHGPPEAVLQVPGKLSNEQLRTLATKLCGDVYQATGIRHVAVKDETAVQTEPSRYDRAPWMQSSKPDASKGTLK